MKRGVSAGLIVALASVLVIAFAGIAGGKIKTKTFSSGTINEEFGGASGTPSSIAQEFALTQKRFKRSKVKDVDVAVRISHTYNNDIDLSLRSPSGRTVELSTDNGADTDDDYGSGDDSCAGTMTEFNDEAETPIEDATSPFNGQFLPEEPLSTLDRTKVKGTWTLTASDDFPPLDDGALHCAELEIKYRKKKKK
jgi:subtilisin-like proprotein convertase family protein